MSSTINLLPCPFCNNAEIAINNENPKDNSGGYFIECPGCGASTSLRFACGDDPSTLLAEQWNRRTVSHCSHQIQEPATSLQQLITEIDQHLRAEWDARRLPAECWPTDLARRVRDAAAGTASAQAGSVALCTCPSGDGSLRWPCPAHQPAAALAAAAQVALPEPAAAVTKVMRLVQDYFVTGTDEARDAIETKLRALLSEVSAPVAPPASQRDDLLQVAIDFIGTLTGMSPPPIEVAPPEVFAPFYAFVDRVQAITAPQAQADARDAAFEAVRKKFCKLQRYSFFLDDKGNVRRTPDYCGNWVEFEAVHTLFEPGAVDAAIATQATQQGGDKQ